LEVEYEDGSRATVVTDASWRITTDGPITASGIYDGETWDDRKAKPGWDLPGYADEAWPVAAAFPLDGRKLVWQRNEPIGVAFERAPEKRTEPQPGVYVFDLGQNLVGWCRLRAKGRAGQPVVIRHAEMLNEDGTPYTANLRGAPQVDRFLPSADGAFEFEPRFTYHGFRYVQVSGLAEPPEKGALRAYVIHSRSPEAGQFECSDASVNQLMRNILWTQRANLMSSPNDCPQRDERFGWMGDIQSFGQTAMFNLDMAGFGSKWVQDIRDDQAVDGRFPDFAPHPGDPNRSFSGAPAWADAGVIYPWRHYQNYADVRLLAEHFDAAQRWVAYIHKLNPDLIWRQGRQNDYNDWLNGDWIKQQGWPAKGGSVPNELLATAFFAHSTELTAKMANVLGRKEEAAWLADLAARIKAAFRKEFLESDGRLKGDTQGGYALALNFDLLPADYRARATELLVEGIRRYQNHLSTGIQTTHRAMLELSRSGANDVAWQMLTNRTFPSWFYMIDNGATTIWERWDGYVKGRGFQDAGMNSFNHWALGSVGEWVWRNVAGLNPDDAQPGWKHFTVAPRPGGGVTWARANFHSLRGEIRVDWRLEAGRFLLRLTIPANTSATVRMPARKPDIVTEGNRPATQVNGVRLVGREADAASFEVSSGNYEFAAPW
jgi:alpha-L-rhamnosidase